jgi:hypothetical protein
VPAEVGVTFSLPLIAFAPDQSPDAVQEVALALDQVSFVDWPIVIDVGEAKIETVGAGGTVTVTVAEADAVPPAPEQDKV